MNDHPLTPQRYSPPPPPKIPFKPTQQQQQTNQPKTPHHTPSVSSHMPRRHALRSFVQTTILADGSSLRTPVFASKNSPRVLLVKASRVKGWVGGWVG